MFLHLSLSTVLLQVSLGVSVLWPSSVHLRASLALVSVQGCCLPFVLQSSCTRAWEQQESPKRRAPGWENETKIAFTVMLFQLASSTILLH